jgi:hypothetical protein
MDTQLFELEEGIGRGKGEDEDQQELIARGLKICSRCPVRKPCGASASGMDKYWTTRGGQPPEGLFPDSKRPAPGNVTTVAGRGSGSHKPKERCKRDHDDWYYDNVGFRRCATCRRENTKSGNEKRKARRARELAG